MRKAWLVFNPVSGRGPADDREIIERVLSRSFEVTTCVTDLERDADHWARRALEAGADVVIAAGGDGTVSAVAEALIGTGVPLGIVPRGTANALCAALGLPTTLEEACEALAGERVKRIDAARVDGGAMVLFAGIGFHASTIERTTREAKSKLGYLAYLFSGLAQLSELEQFSVDIETEDKLVHCRAIAVTVANVAPTTTILAHGPDRIISDDGLLDVTIVAASSLLEAVATGYHLLWSASTEQAARRDNVGYFRCRRVRIVADPPQRVVVDGEVRETTPLEVECLPGALSLLVPAWWEPRRAEGEKLEGLPGLDVVEKS